MADLVIKPAPSTGNKLILQTQNETAVLTTSDAGVDSATSIVATKTGTETLTNKTLTAPTVADMSNCTFPNGHILQVISANKNTTQALTSTSAENWQAVSDLTVNITPQTGNDVLVLVNLNVGGDTDYQNQARLYRGSTAISVGTADGNKLASSFMWRAPGGNHMFNWGGVYLDTSPGGDGSTAITYSIKVSGESNKIMYINRAHVESNLYNFGRQNSSITVMEVQA